ncbi:hypothetical protein T492DRAFT_952949 [Pavlovales sp. CCMP2436]|nr:hypothetical protein T492DRAFT_952949 [Pavlovales sp. CCMP2436]
MSAPSFRRSQRHQICGRPWRSARRLRANLPSTSAPLESPFKIFRCRLPEPHLLALL